MNLILNYSNYSSVKDLGFLIHNMSNRKKSIAHAFWLNTPLKLQDKVLAFLACIKASSISNWLIFSADNMIYKAELLHLNCNYYTLFLSALQQKLFQH